MDVVTLALAKKFTKDTVIGLGAIQGKNCTIDNIVHQNGQNIVTFKWTGDDGTVRTRTMEVEDGTPIYTWTSGDHYIYGDLVIYSSMFYRCTHENSDVEFTPSNWSAIGSSDGNYEIVDLVTQLPVRFTAADRKMYYVISEGAFYLWNGVEWAIQEPKSITASFIDNLFATS